MVLKPGAVAAGVMLIILGVVSLCACIGLIEYAPITNARTAKALPEAHGACADAKAIGANVV